MKEEIAEELQEKFMVELKTLFIKYGAEITVKDEWMGYSECGEDLHVYIESDCFLEDIDLGDSFDPKYLESQCGNKGE